MRITKGELRRIIREEAASLNESAGAMPLVGLTALGNGPMSSRPVASNKSRVISEAPFRELAVVDAALEAVKNASEYAPSPKHQVRLNDIYRDLQQYRQDVVFQLSMMGI